MIYEQYRNNPVAFAKEILGLTLHKKQVEISDAIVEGPRVAAPTTYSGGSTTLAAALTLWWVSSRYPGLAANTAPTPRELKNLLWRRIRRLHAAADLPGEVKVRSWDLVPDRCFAMGFVGGCQGHDLEEQLQKLSQSQNMLLIEDAMGGAPGELPADLELHPTSRHLKIGKPMAASASPGWIAIRVTAFDTPNLDPFGQQPIPGLVDPEWVELMRRRYGEQSSVWRVRVLAELPKAEDQGAVDA